MGSFLIFLSVVMKKHPSGVCPPGSVLVVSRGLVGGVGQRMAENETAKLYQWNLVPQSRAVVEPW